MAKKSTYVLSIDQGTTSSRGVIFDKNYEIVAIGKKEFTQLFPDSGWVEHDPIELRDGLFSVAQSLMKNNGLNASDIASIAIADLPVCLSPIINSRCPLPIGTKASIALIRSIILDVLGSCISALT